ncbi:MAG: HAD-IB family hydrolase [Candidatus Protistobacter heckmanni]|nr:HAD-IB family hydrolase [Candidatus Protistobacter heckmanni]
MAARNLALFDLDHTLLPIDSDHEWGRFLARIGAVDAEEYARKNEQFYQEYKDGKLDIHGFLRFALAPLAAYPREQLAAWHKQFMDEIILPEIKPQARELVERHRKAGDLTAVVTATNSFVTGPIAALFGVEHLLATEPATEGGADGARFTGEVEGLPNFREGKVTRCEDWLHSLGLDWGSFGASHFYSDSANDVPLLEKVTHPVATNPDERLRSLAQARGWPVLELFP